MEQKSAERGTAGGGPSSVLIGVTEGVVGDGLSAFCCEVCMDSVCETRVGGWY